MYDPIDILRRAGVPARAAGSGYQSPIPLMTPEEEDSLLSRMGSSALSGVGYVGQTLDKLFGGRALRGVLGGAPEELLSLLPGSDMLGITDPNNIVSGQDLLANVGYKDAGFIPSFLTEVALDPATLLSGGLTGFGKVLTGAGRAAKSAGLLDNALKPQLLSPTIGADNAIEGVGKLAKGPRELGMTTTLRDVLDRMGPAGDPSIPSTLSPERVAAQELLERQARATGTPLENILDQTLTTGSGAGLPFMSPMTNMDSAVDPITYLMGLSREGFQPLQAAKRFDKAGHYIRSSKPIREGARLFDYGSRGAETYPGQLAFQDGTKAMERETGKVGADIAEVAMRLPQDKRLADLALDTNRSQDLMTAAMENATLDSRVKHAEKFKGMNASDRLRMSLQDNLRHLAPDAPDDQIAAAAEAYHQSLSPIAERLAKIQDRAKELGIDAHEFEGAYSQYGTQRVRNTPEGRPMGKTGNVSGAAVPNRLGSDIQREDWLDLPGGTVGANRAIANWSKEATERLKDPDLRMMPPDAQIDRLSLMDDQFLDWYNETGAREWMTDYMADTIERQMRNGEDWSAIAKTPTRQTIPEDLMNDVLKDTFFYSDDELKLMDDIRGTLGPNRKGKFSEDQIDLYKAFDGDRTKAQALLMNAAKMDPAYQGDVPFFTTDFLRNTLTRLAAGEERIAMAAAAQNVLAKSAVLADVPLGKGPTGTVPLQQALDRMGLKKETALRKMADELFEEGKMPEDEYRSMVAAAGDSLPPALERLGRQVHVPESLVRDAVDRLDLMNDPKQIKWLGGIYDKVTQAFKANVTVPFPAFLSRNLQTGLVQNLETMSYDPRFNRMDPRAWTSPFRSAHDLVTGKELPSDVAKHIAKVWGEPKLTAKEVTDRVRAISFGYGVSPKYAHMAGETIGDTPIASRQLSEEIPGFIPHQTGRFGEGLITEAFDQVPGAEASWLDRLNPAAVRGVTEKSQKAGKSLFAPVAVGENVAEYSEQVLRNSTLIAQLMHGKADDIASEISKMAHVDYSRLTPMDKTMKRLFPFWTFTSRMLPYKLKMLSEKPGGMTRQMLRASEILTQDTDFIPDHVGRQTSIPLGPNEDNPEFDRFLTVDLPHEASFNMLIPGSGLADTLTQTGLGVLGQMNPLLKAPLEVATNRQFFSGRELTDLDPTLGRIVRNVQGMLGSPQADVPPQNNVLLEQALSGSPLSRAATSVRQVTDPRKGWGDAAINALTGVRVSDVNVDKYREIAARELAEKALQGTPYARKFEHMYVPTGEYDNLDPVGQEMARLLRTQSSRKQKEARQRRLIEKQGQQGR